MRSRVVLGGAIFGAAVVLLWVHQVPVNPTPKDLLAVRQLLPGRSQPPSDFDQEVALVLRVQDRVLAASPEERGIPLNQSREITDLLRARHGACFDRSGAAETILRSYGIHTRHASMYSTAETGSSLRSLATPDIVSHALTEVKTSRG